MIANRVKAITIELSKKEKNAIERVTRTCAEYNGIMFASTVNKMYDNLFTIHGRLDSTDGVDTLCDLLEELTEYIECDILEIC